MEISHQLQKKTISPSTLVLISPPSKTLEGFFRSPHFERQLRQNSVELPEIHQNRKKVLELKENLHQPPIAPHISRIQSKTMLLRPVNKSNDFSSKQQLGSILWADETTPTNTLFRSKRIFGESKSSLNSLSYENLSTKDLAEFQKKHIAGLLTPEGFGRSFNFPPSLFDTDASETSLSHAGARKISNHFQDSENSFISPKHGDQCNTLSTDDSASRFEKTRAINPTKLIHQNCATNNLKFYWYHNDNESSESLKPHCREGATLTTVGSIIYLYGGRANGISSEMMVYRARKGIWKRLTVTGDVPKEGRAYHTAVEYNSQIFIFGGQLEKSFYQNRPCLSNEIFKFDPQKSVWKLVPAQGTLIEPRKAHAVCIYEQAMIVYGGIDQYNRYLDDVWAYHLRYNTWKKLPLTEDYKAAAKNGIAYHTMCSVFDSKESLEANNRKLQIEGFYVFGGKNPKGEPVSTLKVLRYEKGGLSFIYPQTRGQPPAPRYSHTMVHYPPENMLVIYGGRNDTMYALKSTYTYNDLMVLNLETLCWLAVSTYGANIQGGRYAHSAAIFQDQMLVFGGMSDSGYSEDDMRALELKSSEVTTLIKGEAEKGDKVNITANAAKKRNRTVLFFSEAEKKPAEKLDSKHQQWKNKIDEALAVEERLRGKNFISYLPIKPGDSDGTAPRYERKRGYHKSYLANDMMHLIQLTETEKRIQKRSASKQ